MIFMDPPDHDRMRALVSRVFTPKAVADLEPMIRGLVAQVPRPARRRRDGPRRRLLRAVPGRGDLGDARRPEADRQQIRHWTDEMLTASPATRSRRRQGMEAGLNLGSTSTVWRRRSGAARPTT